VNRSLRRFTENGGLECEGKANPINWWALLRARLSERFGYRSPPPHVTPWDHLPELYRVTRLRYGPWTCKKRGSVVQNRAKRRIERGDRGLKFEKAVGSRVPDLYRLYILITRSGHPQHIRSSRTLRHGTDALYPLGCLQLSTKHARGMVSDGIPPTRFGRLFLF